MNELRKFFDHLHAHEDIQQMKKHLLASVVVSLAMVVPVAPVSATVVLVLLLCVSLTVNGLGLRIPTFVGYGLGAFMLFALRSVLPGGVYTPEFISSAFAVLVLSQSLTLRKYWHGEILLIWLLACNTATSLLDSSATLSVWIIIVMFFNLGQMLRLHLRNFSLTTLTNSLRSAARTSAYALPMLFIFIYVFQRSYEARHHFSDNSVVGIGRTLEPGKVSKLTMRSGIAYRVVTNRPIPDLADVYWRVATLTRSDGLSWSSSTRSSPVLKTALPSTRCEIIQTVYGQEYDTKAMTIALDRPLETPSSRQYPPQVISSVCSLTESPLTDSERTLYLKTEKPPSAQVQSLLAEIKGSRHTPQEVVDNIVGYFKKEKFTYSLTPSRGPSGDSLDNFLFVTKDGYCEHFAAALGTLLRMAGIPSRVVIGFQGGTYNRYGGYWLISYSDAHAWTEYWDHDRWQRIDATAIVAPAQLHGQKRSRSLLNEIEKLPLVEALWLSMDTLLFNLQKLFAGKDKLISLDDLTMDPFLALGSLFLLFVFLQIKKSWQPLEESVREQFRNLCYSWAGYGMRRGRTEGYETYRQRVVAWMTQEERLRPHIDAVNSLFFEYESFRYGVAIWPNHELKSFVGRIKKIRKIVKMPFRFHFSKPT